MPRTPKARALGNALREARKERELTLRVFGAQIDRDPADLSRWETGERTPKPEQVAQILTALGISGTRYKEIMTLAYNTDAPMWVATSLPEQRQQLAAFLEFEQNASRIVEVAPLLVPGILQTTNYIRAIMTAGGVPQTEIASRVALRIGRREVIEHPAKTQFTALISQGVFYHDVGGRDVTIEQLRHLIKVSRRPNVDLRVIPHGSGWNPALEGSFTLIESEDSTVVVFLETRRSTLYLHQKDDVDAYRNAVDMVLDRTRSHDESVRFLANAVKKMEKSDDPAAGMD
jgi:transcriptional regulator with XRE-family HTH domain